MLCLSCGQHLLQHGSRLLKLGNLEQALKMYEKGLEITKMSWRQSCKRGDDKSEHGLCLSTTFGNSDLAKEQL